MIEQFQVQTKLIATVRDVARMVGLSPARFYQLQQTGVFPMPVYDIISHRPHYTTEQQEQCIEVRRKNCGINGKPVLFYSRRIDGILPTKTNRPVKKKLKSNHGDVLDGVKMLGLTNASSASVDESIKKLFPKGIAGHDRGEVIKAVFVHLKRQSSGDSVGR